MSHLGNLIYRVKKRDRLGHDKLLPKAVRNLREYVQNWQDYSRDEYEEAKELYQEHRDCLDEDEQLPFPDGGRP